MKSIIATLSILISLTATAELKPTGAVVPYLCGQNTLKQENSREKLPMTVCLANETGIEDSNILVLTYNNNEKEYFKAVSENPHSGTTAVEYATVSVNTNGRYTFIGEIDEQNSIFVDRRNGFAGIELLWLTFITTLEPVFTTLSI